MAYKHPRTGKRIGTKQAVRVARQQPFELKVAAPSGMLRHPLFLARL
jgi:hypothetical protein